MRTLRAHVSRIRSAVRAAGRPDPITSARGGAYRLSAEVVTDLAEVTRLRRMARQAAAAGEYDQAADLLGRARGWWSGVLQLPSTMAGQALLLGWEQERRSVTTEHLEMVTRGSRPQDALGELSRLTASEPLDEPTWVQFVTALHASGRQAEALDAVTRARAALAEIGLDPAQALRAAQAAVLAEPDTDEPGAAYAEPGVRVAYTADGATAYTVLSHGTPDLFVLNPAMVTIDGLLDERHVRDAYTSLSARLRVVCLDRRGIGLSAPLERDRPPLEQWVEDLDRVIDHAGSGFPIVLANFDTGLVALEYAALRPDKIAGLVLVNCYARYARGEDYPHGPRADTTTDLIEAAVDPSRNQPLDTAAVVAPSLARDQSFRDWWNRIGRRGAGPTIARIVREVGTTTDLRDRLPRVQCPVLVVPRRQCTNIDPGHSHYLADRLPNARLSPLDGVDGVWFTESRDLVEQVIDFAMIHGRWSSS